MATKYLTKDLKHDIEVNREKIGALETSDAVQNEQIKDLRNDVNMICKTTKELQEVLIASNIAIKIGTWIVGAFGVSVIALVWAMITGQASLVFK